MVLENCREGDNFSDLPLDSKYKNKITNFFSDEYGTWLALTIEQILEHLTQEKNVDIIVFPEYSLPIEINEKIKQIIINFSNITCIVAGIGTVTSCGNIPRKNRFIVAQNGELKYCEKVDRTPEERRLLGIIDGDGPVIHELKIKRYGNSEIIVPFAVLTCRDDLERVKLAGPIHNRAAEELKEKNLQYDDIKLYLVPSFSRNTFDFESLSRMDTKRGPTIVAFANWAPFGGSCIWFPVTASDYSRLIKKFEKNTTGYILSDIPFMYNTTIKKLDFLKTLELQKTDNKSVIFKFKYDDCELDDIQLETESIYILLSERLNCAIEVCGIFLKKIGTRFREGCFALSVKMERVTIQN